VRSQVDLRAAMMLFCIPLLLHIHSQGLREGSLPL
jgi:hypothetical protein